MTTMMREELRDWCDGDPWIKRAKAILAHDASQRATIERLTKELSDEQTKTRQAVEEMVTILDQRVKDVRAERDAALRRAEEAEARCASYERERRETPSLALMEKLNAACAQLAAAEKEIERLRHNPQDCAANYLGECDCSARFLPTSAVQYWEQQAAERKLLREVAKAARPALKFLATLAMVLDEEGSNYGYKPRGAATELRNALAALDEHRKAGK